MCARLMDTTSQTCHKLPWKKQIKVSSSSWPPPLLFTSLLQFSTLLSQFLPALTNLYNTRNSLHPCYFIMFWFFLPIFVLVFLTKNCFLRLFSKIVSAKPHSAVYSFFLFLEIWISWCNNLGRAKPYHLKCKCISLNKSM